MSETISYFESDSNRSLMKPVTVDWATWARHLAFPTKNGMQARDPQKIFMTREAYFSADRETRADAKDIGGFLFARLGRPVTARDGRVLGYRRQLTNVIARSALVLDIDKVTTLNGGTPADWNDLVSLVSGVLDARGWEYLLYPTPSNAPGSVCARLVLPFSREIEASWYAPVARVVMRTIDESMRIFDTAAARASQLMYKPARFADETTRDWAQHVVWHKTGVFMDVENDVVRAAFGDPVAMLDNVHLWPRREGETLEHMHAGLTKNSVQDLWGLEGAFCRAVPIREALLGHCGGAWVEGTSGRLTLSSGSSANGGAIIDGMWLYSHHDTDPFGGRAWNAFEAVRRYRFGALDEMDGDVAGEGEASLQATEGYANAMPEVAAVLASMVAEAAEAAEDGFKAVQQDTGVVVNADDAVLPTWPDPGPKRRMDAIETVGPRDKPRIKESDNTVEAILFNDFPDLMACAGWNESSRCAVWTRPVVINGSTIEIGDVWQGAQLLMSHVIALTGVINRKYGLDVTPERVRRVLFRWAESTERYFHPVRAYLSRCEAIGWDGVPRVETLFIDHLGAVDTPLTRAAASLFMRACVARTFTPGIKVDECVVLVGGEGIGKSTLPMLLCPSSDMFTDNLPVIRAGNTRELLEATDGKWIVEIAELVSFERGAGGPAAAKAFLSRPYDVARKAYATDVTKEYRHWVPIGTTNESEFLVSKTGNRRYLPVQCAAWGKLDWEAAVAVRDQLWAEALALYAETPTLALPPEIEALARAEQQARRIIDRELLAALERYLDCKVDETDWQTGFEAVYEETDEPNERRSEVCVQQLYEKVEGGRLSDRDAHRRKREIVSLMDDYVEGWGRAENRPRLDHYGRPRNVWQRVTKGNTQDQS